VRDIAVCYAPGDETIARQLIDYLKLNIDARVDPAVITPWLDLPDAVESTSTAWRTVAILSPASLPAPLPRDRWDAIPRQNLAWALAAPCPFAPILRRRPFFDLTTNPSAAFRSLRAWILDETSASAAMPDAYGFIDQPAQTAVPSAAAVESARPYFESVLELDARSRSLTSLTAELAGLLGFDRSLDRETLRASALDACRSHRRLLVLHGADPGIFGDLGRTSVVAVPAPPPSILAPSTLIDIIRQFQTGRGPAPTPADLDRALSSAFASNHWPSTRDLARAAFSYLRDEYRLAEAYDLLESLKQAAHFHGDPDVIDECVRHQEWIGERWSAETVAEVLSGAVQLRFAW
jgi:hypothetical protein